MLHCLKVKYQQSLTHFLNIVPFSIFKPITPTIKVALESQFQPKLHKLFLFSLRLLFYTVGLYSFDFPLTHFTCCKLFYLEFFLFCQFYIAYFVVLESCLFPVTRMQRELFLRLEGQLLKHPCKFLAFCTPVPSPEPYTYNHTFPKGTFVYSFIVRFPYLYQVKNP